MIEGWTQQLAGGSLAGLHLLAAAAAPDQVASDMWNMPEMAADLKATLPILIMCGTALVVMFLDWFLRPRTSWIVGVVALAGLACAGLALFGTEAFSAAEPIRAFKERLVIDPLTVVFTAFFVVAAAFTVVVSLRTRMLRGQRVGDYFTLLVLATAAMAVVVASRDFLLLYLAIETVSLPSYVLVGFRRGERLSTEASLKYILYGSVASGVMLFGISYAYGLTGTTIIPSMYSLQDTLTLQYADGTSREFIQTIGFGAAMIMILAGLGFKMALVPFHSWCPDVYQGGPTPIVAYLSVASKGAGFAALLRVVYPVFCASVTGGGVGSLVESINPWLIFWILSVVTMTFGNLVAVWQTNVKRLLAYSSIAHAGYLTMAFSLMNQEAFEAVLIYLGVYLVMNLGAFFTVLFIENETGSCELDTYRGLIRRSPLLVVVFVIFLLSLLGIPPTAGFMAKFKMFGALIKAWTQSDNQMAFWLAIIGVANTVVSAYYYLKIVKVMILDRGEDESRVTPDLLGGAILVGLAVVVFVMFVFWTPVQTAVESIPLDLTVF